MVMKRTIPLALVVALALAACNGNGATDLSLPDDPEAVVLTVTSEGGFMPVEANLDRMPRYVLTADRSLYYVGPTTLEFPGPLLPNVQVTTVDEDTMGEILGLVEQMGLPEVDEEVDDSGADRIADASTDFISYFDEQGAHRMGFYALGLSEGGSTERLLAGEVVEFLDQAASRGDSRPYEPDRLQVAAGPPMQVEEGMASVEEWPLDTPFADMEEWGMGWRCVEVSGGEATDLFEVFSDANQATLWDTGDEEVGIRARPLLPGESGCVDVPGMG